jgi:putative acetyltransferase
VTDVPFHFAQAESAEQIEEARALFREYSEQLGVDLCFQGFEQELAGLPGEYAPPKGRLLLASHGGSPIGCAALRDLGGGACEMKRLYVRSEGRGVGVGRRLAEALIAEARAIGYTLMRLDTLPQMREALILYRSLGFYEIGPYRFNPVEGTVYLEKRLQD